VKTSDLTRLHFVALDQLLVSLWNIHKCYMAPYAKGVENAFPWITFKCEAHDSLVQVSTHEAIFLFLYSYS
jgi:hypothetical protein